jgi:hypothetical protein
VFINLILTTLSLPLLSNTPLCLIRYDCNDYETATSLEQCECERDCASFLTPLERLSQKRIKELTEANILNDHQFKLLRDHHIDYLKSGLGALPAGFVSLDSSRPWIAYWYVSMM